MFVHRAVAILVTTSTFVPAQYGSQDLSSASIRPSTPKPPFTDEDRLYWIIKATVGPKNLAAGAFVSGIRTWRNEPEEYGPHWEGFGKRYGARFAAGGTSNILEAGFGRIWGEDPRYFR